jgi:hypothetical protein
VSTACVLCAVPIRDSIAFVVCVVLFLDSTAFYPRSGPPLDVHSCSYRIGNAYTALQQLLLALQVILRVYGCMFRSEA